MSSKPQLMIPIKEASDMIRYFCDRGHYLHLAPSSEGLPEAERLFQNWMEKVSEVLTDIFTTPEIAERFIAATNDSVAAAEEDVNKRRSLFDALLNSGLNFLDDLRAKLPIYETKIEAKREALDVIHQICSQFSVVVRQLRRRYDERQTLNVADEHDAQDLLHALLRIFFDDIRPEEYSPSYAGGASRIDFLLKTEQILIELKMTRPTLKEKQLGEELIIDIERYKNHPDCRLLYCFVYDPDSYIRNPRGIEADLTRSDGPFPVQVFIAPK